MTVFQYLAKIAYIDLTKKFSFFFIATHKKIDYNLLPILLYICIILSECCLENH